jgi:copper chaperone CopZ
MMTHNYNITGMTCSSCLTKVKAAFLTVPGITVDQLQLQSPQAIISMDRHVPLAVLQAAIGNGNKYIISEAFEQKMDFAENDKESKPSYYPIYLIFGYITVISLIITSLQPHADWMMWMRNFMAGFFLLFSFFKLLNLSAFAEGYSTYDVIAKKARWYGFVYPFIELGLGIAYLTNFSPIITNLIAIVVMGISTIGVVQSLLKKSRFQCACLGTIIKLPLSKVTLFEDLLMIVMSGISLVYLLY